LSGTAPSSWIEKEARAKKKTGRGMRFRIKGRR
jgi:hypothetical protein